MVLEWTAANLSKRMLLREKRSIYASKFSLKQNELSIAGSKFHNMLVPVCSALSLAGLLSPGLSVHSAIPSSIHAHHSHGISLHYNFDQVSEP